VFGVRASSVSVPSFSTAEMSMWLAGPKMPGEIT
jgi:hypothetical protein